MKRVPRFMFESRANSGGFVGFRPAKWLMMKRIKFSGVCGSQVAQYL
jgi:hypothetical protein